MFGRWFGQHDWCCQPFRELHEARYGRGLFVFVRPLGWAGSTTPTFWLAFRSVRQPDLARLPVPGLPPIVPITISTSRRIFRCPWCGAELERFYRERSEELLDPAIFQEFELPTSEETGA